ncbi:phosphonate ABC transporter ATP-binding protein [Pseudonocardia spinosispora]|uniref:phosphonate ABC transporter ATP-binding protein n=1 Tax=Pseudonocardia spinosispora TaxID=103441 RepID=UPI0004193EB0|nr:phosphonate ABC transporter ATP-binding protein [Pseudonocardia spinosispora]
MSTPDSHGLEIQGLGKRYPNGPRALDDVSLTVRPGELVALLGPNGSGKSTLLRCVVRLVEPDAGSVRVAGTELTALRGEQLRRARTEVAMVFQRSYLVRRRSALDNVAAGALGHHPGWRTSLGRLPRTERERAGDLLTRVGLSSIAGQRADTLSGGQAQRTAVARALAQRPRVLLADEPVASLDPESATATMRLLRELADQEQIAVLCVLHQPDLALAHADRIVALREGRVVLNSPVPDIAASTVERLTTNRSAQ